MYTLWNPEPDAQELLVTLRYGANGTSYKLPLTLEAYASTMIDIGELIRTRQLDQNGALMPVDVQQGSFVVGSPTERLADAVDVVVGMGIYNPTKATCGSGTLYCNGMVSSPGPQVQPANATLGVGGTQQFQLVYYDNNGQPHDATVLWASNPSAVLGIDPASGLATAFGVGGALVTAETNGLNNQVPIYAVINWSGQQPTCPMENVGGAAGATAIGIAMNGQDVTGKTTTVAVGQQIALTVTGVNQSQVSSQTWNISGPSGSYVAGYNVASDGTSASIPSLNTAQSSVTYYYTAAGSSTVTYTANTSGGTPPTAKATTTFTVVAPTYGIATAVGTVNVNQDDGWQLQLGRSLPANGPRGVAFTATVTPPAGFSGASQWVQIVNSVSQTSAPNGGTCTGSGLDTQYPYRTGGAMSDSPLVALESQYTTSSISMSLTAYLQWQPPTPSIPVAIAQVPWGWSGTATQTGSTWALTTSSPPQPAAQPPQTALPTWGQMAGCQ